MVMIRPPDGAANQEAAVAATDVHHDRCLAAKDGRPVKGAFVGQALEGGLSPTGPVENFAGDGDAKLALLVPDLFHESYLSRLLPHRFRKRHVSQARGADPTNELFKQRIVRHLA